MTVKLTLRKEEYEVDAGLTVREALEAIAVPPETVIPTRQGKLVDEDELLQDGDVIKLVTIISGG